MYDSQLRRSYCTVIWWLVGGLTVIAVCVALAASLSVASFVLAAVPAAPALTWALRETRRQAETIEQQARLKVESEKALQGALAGAPVEEADRRSRELQDAIYAHRVSSPLILDLVYLRKRDDLECAMEHGADVWVERYTRSTGAKNQPGSGP
jgi:hypothetical protein